MRTIKELLNPLKKNKAFISYELAKHRFIVKEKLKQMAYDVKKRKLNMIIGGSIALFGFITLPLPTGSIFFIGLGSGLFLSSLPIGKFLKLIISDIRIIIETKLILWGFI